MAKIFFCGMCKRKETWTTTVIWLWFIHIWLSQKHIWLRKISLIKKGRARGVTKSVTKPQRKQFSGQIRNRNIYLTVYIFKFVISDLVESLQWHDKYIHWLFVLGRFEGLFLSVISLYQKWYKYNFAYVWSFSTVKATFKV